MMFSCCFPLLPHQVEAPSSTALLTALCWEEKLPGTRPSCPSPPSGSCWGVSSSSSCSAGREALSHNKWQLLRAARWLQQQQWMWQWLFLTALGLEGSCSFYWAGEHRPRADQSNTCSASWQGWQIMPRERRLEGTSGGLCSSLCWGRRVCMSHQNCPFLSAVLKRGLAVPPLCYPPLSWSSETQLLQPAGKSCHRPD